MDTRKILALFLAAVLTTPLVAGPSSPPPPDEYDVIIRYRIDAARTERIIQFRAMMRYLESLGFDKDPSENENEVEDRTATEMTGHIKSANARKILLEPHIRTIMLYPKGANLPADAEQFVRVDLGLTADLKEDLQHKLYNQTGEVLRSLGFQEGVGYDNRGGSRIVGNVAAKNLLALLEDLRKTQAGAKMPNPSSSKAGWAQLCPCSLGPIALARWPRCPSFPLCVCLVPLNPLRNCQARTG
jgi:hypothetical protein